jgi:hypothetical protein
VRRPHLETPGAHQASLELAKQLESSEEQLEGSEHSQCDFNFRAANAEKGIQRRCEESISGGPWIVCGGDEGGHERLHDRFDESECEATIEKWGQNANCVFRTCVIEENCVKNSRGLERFRAGEVAKDQCGQKVTF